MEFSATVQSDLDILTGCEAGTLTCCVLPEVSLFLTTYCSMFHSCASPRPMSVEPGAGACEPCCYTTLLTCEQTFYCVHVFTTRDYVAMRPGLFELYIYI